MTQSGSTTGFGINHANLSTMLGLVTTGSTLTTGVDFSSAAALAAYDAFWVNDRHAAGGVASAAEIDVLQQFIRSGKKAVFITNNDGWANWNNSIERILGAHISATSASAATASRWWPTT